MNALCINQKNFEERQQQIQLMGRIYSQAEYVYVNLGHVNLDWFSGFMVLLRLAHAWDDFCHESEKGGQLDPDSIPGLLAKHDLPPFEYEGWRKYYHIFDSP